MRAVWFLFLALAALFPFLSFADSCERSMVRKDDEGNSDFDYGFEMLGRVGHFTLFAKAGVDVARTYRFALDVGGGGGLSPRPFLQG